MGTMTGAAALFLDHPRHRLRSHPQLGGGPGGPCLVTSHLRAVCCLFTYPLPSKRTVCLSTSWSECTHLVVWASVPLNVQCVVYQLVSSFSSVFLLSSSLCEGVVCCVRMCVYVCVRVCARVACSRHLDTHTDLQP